MKNSSWGFKNYIRYGHRNLYSLRDGQQHRMHKMRKKTRPDTRHLSRGWMGMGGNAKPTHNSIMLRMQGHTDGRTDRLTDRQTDRRTDQYVGSRVRD